IIEKHGTPNRILTDCGLEFKKQVFEAFMAQWQIQICSGSPHHHNTTGAVERANQTFMNKLRKLTNFGELD
ncbi:MAG: hypothetical protein ACRC1D_00060, partial [Culicoidibacterales bacterium]